MNQYMNKYDLDGLKSVLSDGKKDHSYVGIDNLSVDLRKLKRIDAYTANSYKKINSHGMVASFEIGLGKYCDELIKRGIPFDSIKVKGNPGLIVNSQKHQEFLKEVLKKNYIEYLTTIRKVDNEWSKDYTKSFLSNLTISDTLYNYVPLTFTLEPLITVHDDRLNTNDLVSPFKFLNLDEEQKTIFNQVVPFNEFVEELNNDGYHLMFRGLEVKNYDEYFTKMIDAYEYDRLLMNINLSEDTNNIRR